MKVAEEEEVLVVGGGGCEAVREIGRVGLGERDGEERWDIGSGGVAVRLWYQSL